MWSKPSELSRGAYPGPGFEIAFWTTGSHAEAGEVMRSWMESSPHNAVILERGVWANANWRALGVGVFGGYVVAWFGKDTDRTH